MPYPVMNTLLDAGYPDGVAQLLALELHPRAAGRADRHRRRAVRRPCPSPMTAILFEHFHGAVTRVGVDRHRRAAPRAGLEPPASRRCGPTRPTPTPTSRWTRETFAALRPHLAERPLAQLPRRRPGRRRDPGRLRPELRPARRGQAPLRPRQRLPPQPQHRPLSGSRTSPGGGPARARRSCEGLLRFAQAMSAAREASFLSKAQLRQSGRFASHLAVEVDLSTSNLVVLERVDASEADGRLHAAHSTVHGQREERQDRRPNGPDSLTSRLLDSAGCLQFARRRGAFPA